MAIKIDINPHVVVPIKHSTAGTITQGRGGVFTGAVDAEDGSFLVTAPSGVDGIVDVVSYRNNCSDTIVGNGVIVGLSPVQLLAGSGGVNFGDEVNIKNAAGEWKKAGVGEVNIYFKCMQTIVGAGLFWALPIAK